MNKKIPNRSHYQIFRIVSITGFVACLICASALTLVAATSRGQTALDKKVTVSIKDQTLENALEQLAKAASVTISYGNNRALEDHLSIRANDERLGAVLDRLLYNRPFSYVFIDGKIMIRFTPDKPKSKKVDAPPVTGKVTDDKGKPLPGATIRFKNTGSVLYTDNNGEFQISDVRDSTVITVSFIGYNSREVTLKPGIGMLAISLQPDANSLQDIVVSTGYQELPKERATGSFTKIDNTLFNRAVGTNIVDRLDGVTSGLIFNRNYFVGDANSSSIAIRGLSTIYANAKPLIVVDNFPIDGDLSNINPNDVQDITVLKDAAAASIWGARSGNGVIVINTKRGKIDRPLQIQFNANYTLIKKGNAYYNPNFLNSSDFINSEMFLFGKGFYDADLSNTSNPPVISPVVETLNKERSGTLSAPQADIQISAFRNKDIRNDISEYLYQNTGVQQYALNLNGGSEKATYYFSAGYDNVPSTLVGNNYNRFNLSSNSVFRPWKNIEITTGLIYTISNSVNNNSGYLNPGSGKSFYYPYAQLADNSGNYLTLPKDFRYSYLSSPGDTRLLDWTYNPLSDIGLTDNTTKSNYTRFNTSLKHKLFNGLEILVSYQLEKQNSGNENLQTQQSYYTRNLINLYTQVNGGMITRPIPLGDILDQNRSDFSGNSIRGQINFSRTFRNNHELSAIAGIEGKQLVTKQNYNRQYGYSSPTGFTTPVDYVSTFNQYNNLSFPTTIPYYNSIDKLTDEFFSYFANASYSYKDRYILSGSGRIDQSNLFGVNTNQKSVPLWSTGVAWEISKEAFYSSRWLPYLKLRTTYGYNGNIDKSTSAFTTALSAGTSILTGAPYVLIQNPPNPELRWERIGMLNLGIDFASRNQVISGSLEYYQKKGIDILGFAPVDPTTGVTRYKGNVANIQGNGFDIDLVFRAGNQFQWIGNVLVSKAMNKVTKYNATTSLSSYLQSSDGGIGISAITPVIGRPIFSIYSYKWAGLDPQTGDPQGYLNGQISKDYATISSSKNIDDAVYNGPARPTVFGSFRNTLNYKGISLSWNIIYELGFYFRRPSINYTNLAYSWTGNNDYDLRWQQPGDETHTNVPSFTYPLNSARDNFYQYSSVLVDKGDNIRLKDITLSYDVTRIVKKLPFKNLQVYGYASNLGILWKATKSSLDPDYVNSNYSAPLTISLGIKTNIQ